MSRSAHCWAASVAKTLVDVVTTAGTSAAAKPTAYPVRPGVFADQDRDVAGRDRLQTPVCAEQSAGTAEQGH